MKVKVNNDRENRNRTYSTRRDYVHECVLKIAAGASAIIQEATQAIYLEALLELDDDAIELAVKRTRDEWDKPHTLPPLSFIKARSGQGVKLHAEQAWELVQHILSRYWHPDVGFYPDCPRRSPAIEYAIRQCGGVNRIHEASDQAFSFIRRDFCEAFERFTQEGGEQHWSRELAKQKYEELVAARDKQLAAEREEKPEQKTILGSA